jgi:hypothetical protein
LPKRGSPIGGNGRTDLLVLVQVHADVATAPVVQLGRRLTFEGLVALTLILTAIAAMWLIVIHILGIPGCWRTGKRVTGWRLRVPGRISPQSRRREVREMMADHRSRGILAETMR